MAKPIPTLAPVGLKIAVVMPISLPEESINGPPELPGLMEASVWMMSSTRVPFSALIVRPHGTDHPRRKGLAQPKGIPDCHGLLADFKLGRIAHRDYAHAFSGSLYLENRQIGVRIGAHKHGRVLFAVGKGDFHLSIPDHMIVCQDVAAGIDNRA